MLLPAVAYMLAGLAVEGPLIDWLVCRSLPEALNHVIPARKPESSR
jgi:hypothetical protein